MRRILILCLVVLLCASIMITGCTKKSPTDNSVGTSQETAENDNKTSENKTSDSNTSQASESEDSSTVNPPGTFPLVDEKITFKVLFPQAPQIEDIETNKFTKFYEEKTNVHVEWQLVPQKDMSQKVNLILATQSDLPDIMMGAGLGNATLVKYGAQGVFIPLNDLIDKYAIEFKKVVENHYPDLLKMLTAPDGNIYSLPKINECLNCDWSQKMWINKTFLDTLGLDEPKTTEEFYEVLKAFKERDPNGNGKADEIPLVGANTGWRTNIDGFLMNSFIYNDSEGRFILENGKVDVACNKPEWKDGLAYLNKLCMEGLLDPVSFTQDVQQLTQLVENEEAMIVGAVPAGNIASANNAGERKKNYIAIAPLKGSKGVQLAAHYKYVSIQNGIFAITSACKYPEVALRWADWFYTEEGTMWSRWGELGTDWVRPEKGVPGVFGDQAIIQQITVWGTVQNSHWQNITPCFVTHEMVLGQAATDPWAAPVVLNTVTREKYEPYGPKEVLPPLFMTAEESEEYLELSNNINDYVKENIARFTTGDRDLEKEWEQYLKDLENMGLNRYIELTQNAYDRQYK